MSGENNKTAPVIIAKKNISIFNGKDRLEFNGLPHAMAFGKKMRSYNPDLMSLRDCYWAFLEDIEDGLLE